MPGIHLFSITSVTVLLRSLGQLRNEEAPAAPQLVFSGYQAGDSLTGDLGWDLYTAGLKPPTGPDLLSAP